MTRLSILFYTLVFEKWSLCISMDLVPLMWLAGFGFEAPDEDAEVPAYKLTFNVPTLRLEFQWAENAKLAELEDRLHREEQEQAAA